MKNAILIALCFLAGLAGANVQPLLTGAGKILFPENATPATISASSGALTIAAGGSNQNVVLAPSGSGVVNATGYFSFGSLFSALYGGHLKGDAGGSTTLPNTTIVIEDTNATAPGRLVRLSAQRNNLWLTQNLAFDGTNWNLDQTAVGGTLIQMNGGVVIVSSVTAGANPRTLATTLAMNGSYALDAVGDINASGVFRKGGTAGTGGNTLFTVCTSGACTTSCTLQFNGGIRVGGTCP